MNALSHMILNYFRPPVDAFWEWADNGEVIQWRIPGGGTICYRADLVRILRGLQGEGFPPLTAVLLILDTCRRKEFLEALRNWLSVDNLGKAMSENGGEAGEEPERIERVFALLQVVQRLPDELRSGDMRINLLMELSQQPPAIKAADSRKALREFESGNYDALIFHKKTEFAPACLLEVVQWLEEAGTVAVSEEALVTLLRTGMEVVPEPAPMELPEVPASPDLLEEMETHPRTVGLARLTRRVIAALNLPMHATGSSDQSFGGVSDITNRGNFDRLLLSELAYDDTTLMARLANNEALYLRREEPPQNIVQERVVLMDITLRMWGLPRVFAVATALACAQHNQHEMQMTAFALGGDSLAPVALNSQEGVLEALEKLDHALHPGNALAAFWQSHPANANAETILITSVEVLHSAEFSKAMQAAALQLNYLLTVSREGELEIFQYIGGRRKQLNTAKFDLSHLLFSGKLGPVTTTKRTGVLPQFYQEEMNPLRFPTIGVQLYESNTYTANYYSIVLAVSQSRRLLLWTNNSLGAEELLPYIEFGKYAFGNIGIRIFYLVVQNSEKGILRLHRFEPGHDTPHTVVELDQSLLKAEKVLFRGEAFFFAMHSNAKGIKHYLVVDPETGEIVDDKSDLKIDIALKNVAGTTKMNINRAKRVVNNGYTVLQKLPSIAVGADFKLHIGKRYLDFPSKKIAQFVIAPKKNSAELHYSTKAVAPEPYDADNPGLHLIRYTWSDGSEACVDQRGFLHLRSANPSLPEMTIALIIGKPTGCWTSDGRYFGSGYFTYRNRYPEEDDGRTFEDYIMDFVGNIVGK